MNRTIKKKLIIDLNNKKSNKKFNKKSNKRKRKYNKRYTKKYKKGGSFFGPPSFIYNPRIPLYPLNEYYNQLFPKSSDQI